MAMVDIVGGGIGGLVLARNLLQQNVQVRVWERAQSLGGLMGRIRLDELGGVEVDRYYHAILSSDRTLMQLIDELGLRSSLHMQATRMGFYHGGRTYPMSTPLEFLRFPPLSMIDRARLAFTILAARRVRDWRELEQIPVLDWLTGLSGSAVVEKIWKPLLRAKFDGGFEKVPATYIWSRLVRTTSSHDKGARELMCFLEGGYMQLIQALADDVRRRGGQITLGATVEQVLCADGRAAGLRVDGASVQSNGVVLTIQTPAAQKLLPPDAITQRERWGRLNEYLGITCVLLVLRRRLIPYYTLNITDSRIPFTGVIETTNLIDPKYSGGHHLVYLPKYVSAGSAFAQMGEEEITRRFIGYLQQMFPDLTDQDIAAVRVGRERFVEPLHPVGQTDDTPPVVGEIPGLFLANAAQIYPQLTNGESVVAHAGMAAEAIIASLRHKGITRPIPALAPTTAAAAD